MKIRNIGRTAAFQEYLDRQTPERVAEILAAEKVFTESQFARGTVREQAEAQFLDDMTLAVPAETPGDTTIENLLDSQDRS